VVCLGLSTAGMLCHARLPVHWCTDRVAAAGEAAAAAVNVGFVWWLLALLAQALCRVRCLPTGSCSQTTRSAPTC
jgi:hypothetical protein